MKKPDSALVSATGCWTAHPPTPVPSPSCMPTLTHKEAEFAGSASKK